MSEELDPMERMEQRALEMEHGKRAEDNLSKAKTMFMLGSDGKLPAFVFFATISSQVKYIPDWSIGTACTNGVYIKYNPKFVNSLTLKQLRGLLAHEVMHIALHHASRMRSRDPKRWNIACDLAINHILIESGTELPGNGCFPGEGIFKDLPKGLSAEEYYPLLPEGCENQCGGGDDPFGCGGVESPGIGAEADHAEANEKLLVAGAAQAAERASKGQGKIPAGLARVISQSLECKIPWQAELREFVSAKAKEDYSWSPLNRRFLHRGIRLPSRGGQRISGIVIAVDTSGSIGEEILSAFAAEIEGIMAISKGRLTILYHDSEVAGVQEWDPNDGPLVLDPKGGGGTDHRPVFKWVDEADDECTALICLTDMYSCFHKTGPDYPVLFCSIVKGQTPPFGRLIHLELDRY